MKHYTVTSVRSFDGIRPQLAPGVFVDPSAVVLGDVHIGPESSVWPQAVVRGDMHRIRIGRCTSVQDGSILHITHETVKRPQKVRVSALDRDGEPFSEKLEGLAAVCLQHEIDHLDGKLFVDYISPLKRQRIRKKLEKSHRLRA